MSHTLAETYQYASQYIRLSPLTFTTGPAGGRAGDPALSIGDWVRQFILAPPFAWRWNRAVLTPIPTVVGTQDYSANTTTFGWMEKATVTLGSDTKELNVALGLPEESSQNLPVRISAQTDSGTAISFRLSPVPDAIYSLKITYQKAAVNFTTTAGNWDPIPDYMYYIYSQGVLAKAYEYLGDERWPGALQLFFKQLIAFHGGLTESQVNIFMGERTATQAGVQAALAKLQQAVMARGLQ